MSTGMAIVAGFFALLAVLAALSLLFQGCIAVMEVVGKRRGAIRAAKRRHPSGRHRAPLQMLAEQ